MKSKKISITIIITIILIGIIVTFIRINLNAKNSNIKKKIEDIEQLTTTTNDNAYISMSTHLSEIAQIEDSSSVNLVAYDSGLVTTNNTFYTISLSAGTYYFIGYGFTTYGYKPLDCSSLSGYDTLDETILSDTYGKIYKFTINTDKEIKWTLSHSYTSRDCYYMYSVLAI